MKFSSLFNEYIFNILNSNLEKIVYQIKIRIIPLKLVFFSLNEVEMEKRGKVTNLSSKYFLFDIIIVSDFRFRMRICRKSRCVLFEQIFPSKINETQFGTNLFQNFIYMSDFYIHFLF